MCETCFAVLLARAGMSHFLIPVPLCLLFCFLIIKALRSGKVYYRGTTYTKEEDYMMFWMVILILSTSAFLSFVAVLSEMFEP